MIFPSLLRRMWEIFWKMENYILFHMFFWHGFMLDEYYKCPSQWPRGLRHEPSSPARTLGSCVRIPLDHGCLCAFILYLCSVCR
jgi:hypothetical protein